MFSAKNYGLPKDLIEAAKKVHEKQLEEQQKPTSLRQAVGRVGLAVQGVVPRKATKPSAKDVYNAMGSTKPKRAKRQLTYIQSRYHNGDTKSEEVQFTEEELAEAFAIFLEENFHVDMLTEEDLDYIFENEFPQWLEEGLTIIPKTAAEIKKEREEQRKRDDEEAKKNEKIPMV